jgi:two-component system phosphate regulon response regulator PhoB
MRFLNIHLRCDGKRTQNMPVLIFVVESDIEVCRKTRMVLEEAGYGVRAFLTPNLMEEMERRRPALVLIDASLPDSGGLDLCCRIRQTPSVARTPIIFTTSGSTGEDRVRGLELGGDDCIGKPFNPRELVARVQAVLRRFARRKPAPVMQIGDIEIDLSAMRLSVRGSEVSTTALEFRLMDYLARNQGRVFTRDQLLDAVWGEMQFVTPRSVDACVRRIREKIEPDSTRPTYLKTIRGVGYRLDPASRHLSLPPQSLRMPGSSISHFAFKTDA